MVSFKIDVPGEIRTPDRTLRRRMLYPAELLGHDNIFNDKFYYIRLMIKCQHKNITYFLREATYFPPLVYSVHIIL